jgi:hypothetical protein
MEEIRREDGDVFKSKAPLAAALSQRGLTESYNIIEKEDGFVAVPKEPGEITNKVVPKNKKVKKYRVHRSNCDPDNKDVLISVTFNTAANRMAFWPGEEVELTESQVNVLKNSVEEVRIVLPPESGVYSSENPLVVAKSFYPNMQAELDRSTNLITMVQRTPNYIIEEVSGNG